MRGLRDPVLVFFLIGAGFFLLYGVSKPPTAEPVTLSDAGLAVLLAEYETLTGRPPDAARRREILDDYYRREVLFREALRTDIHERDPSLREATIERMQQRVAGELPEPSGRDLVNYYADNIERYYAEATISVSQRFLREAPADGARLLDALAVGKAPPFDAPPGGEYLPAYGASMLRALFGGAVLDGLRGLPVGIWSGPYESPRGWHYFRVDGRSERALLAFAGVEDQVRADYQADVLDARVNAFVEEHRRRYRLERPSESALLK